MSDAYLFNFFFALESLLKLPFIKSHMIRGNIIKGNEKEEDFVCFDIVAI